MVTVNMAFYKYFKSKTEPNYDVLTDPHGPLAFIIPSTTIESSHRGQTHGGSYTYTWNNMGVGMVGIVGMVKG